MEFVHDMIEFIKLVFTSGGRLSLLKGETYIMDFTECDGGSAILITLEEGIINLPLLIFVILAIIIYYSTKCKKEKYEESIDFFGYVIRESFEMFLILLLAILVLNFIYKLTELNILAIVIPFVIVIFYVYLFLKFKKELTPEFLYKLSIKNKNDRSIADKNNYNIRTTVFNNKVKAFGNIPFDLILLAQRVDENVRDVEFNIDFPEFINRQLTIDETEDYFDLENINNELQPVFARLNALGKEDVGIDFIEITSYECHCVEDLFGVLEYIFEQGMDWPFFVRKCFSFAYKYVEDESDNGLNNGIVYFDSEKSIFSYPKIKSYFGFVDFPYNLLTGLFTANSAFKVLGEFYARCQYRLYEIENEFLKTRGIILAGNNGEDILRETFELYNDDEVKFFPNVRLSDTISVENDGLVITENAIYSIESKHYSGDIHISKTGKWTREKNGSIENLKVNSQSNNHIIISERVINSKLKEMGIEDKIHIIPIIVMTNDNANVTNESDLLVVHPSMLSNIFRENKDKNYTKKMRKAIIKVIEDNKLDLVAYDKIDLAASLNSLIDFIVEQRDEINLIKEDLCKLLDDEKFNDRVKANFSEQKKINKSI